MNFIFIFISSSDPNLLRNGSVKQKIKNDGLPLSIKLFTSWFRRQDFGSYCAGSWSLLVCNDHYENMYMQYKAIFHGIKNEKYLKIRLKKR